MHFLRRILGHESVASRGTDEIGLAFHSIDCDTVAFRSALDRNDWPTALDIYRGELLDGFFVSDLPEFEQWLEETRIAYRDEAVRAAWALSEALVGQQEFGDAKRWARWAAGKTPFDESSFRRYLELLGQTGDRATAVHAYSEFATRLGDELGVTPSQKTAELADAIRRGTAQFETKPTIPVTDDRVGVVGAAVQPPSRAAAKRVVTTADQQPIRVGERRIARKVPGTGVVFATELWSRIVLTVASAVVALGVADAAVLQLGLPTWVFWGSAGLVAAGLFVLVTTAVVERRRATSLMQATFVRSGTSDFFRWRPAFKADLVAWLGLGVATAGYVALRVLGIGPPATLLTKGVLEDRDEILIADFESHAGDSLLGHAMTEAMRIDLSQSRTFRLVDPGRINTALAFMSADLSDLHDVEVAREVAQRLGVKAILQGDVTPVGDGYLLTTTLLSADGGAILWAGRAQADGDDGLIRVIGALSRRVRAEIGESLREVRTTPPLHNVTTTSLDALKAFSEGERIVSYRDQLDALPYFARAVALDSTFAVAHMRIARVLANTNGSRTRQAEHIDKAFRLRERATEIERLTIESNYYALTGESDQALATWGLLTELQPEVHRWWNNIGYRVGANLEDRFPDHEQGIAYLNRAFEICRCGFVLGNLIYALLVAGMVDSAASVIETQFDRFPEMPAWQLQRGIIAYDVGDFSLAIRELEAEGRLAHVSAILAVQGKLSASRGVYQSRVDQWGGNVPAVPYLNNLANQEMLGVLHGEPTEEAVQRVEDALRVYPLDSIEPLDRPYLSLAEFFVRAGQVGRADGLMDEFEAVVEPRWRRVNAWRASMIRGLIEQEQRGSERAIPTLERAVREAHAYLGPVPDFGFALDRVGATDSAIAVFQRFIGPSPRYAAYLFDSKWRAAVLKRLGELYEERGDRVRAMDYYQQFVEQWRDADSVLLPQVDDVRNRIRVLADDSAR